MRDIAFSKQTFKFLIIKKYVRCLPYFNQFFLFYFIKLSFPGEKLFGAKMRVLVQSKKIIKKVWVYLSKFIFFFLGRKNLPITPSDVFVVCLRKYYWIDAAYRAGHATWSIGFRSAESPFIFHSRSDKDDSRITQADFFHLFWRFDTELCCFSLSNKFCCLKTNFYRNLIDWLINWVLNKYRIILEWNVRNNCFVTNIIILF